MRDRRQRPFMMLRNVAFLLSWGWRHARGYLLASFGLAVFHRAVIFFEHTWSIKFIIDCIQYGRPFSAVVAYILTICGLVTAVLFLAGFLSERVQPQCRERIHLQMRRDLQAKAAAVDLSCYDNPEFFNDFVWVLNEAPDEFDRTMDRVRGFLGGLTSMVMAGGFVILVDPAGLLFVGVSVVGTLALNSVLGRMKFRVDAETNPKRRRMAYAARVYFTADFAKELRLSRVASLLKKGFADASAEVEGVIRKHSRRQVILGFLVDFVLSRLILDGAYVLWLVWKVMVLGWASYGDMVALFSSASTTKGQLQSLTTMMSDFSATSLFVEKMRRFLALETGVSTPRLAKPLPPGRWTLELKDVSFRYPGSDHLVLHGVNLTIRSGETLALVGHNGAGKTSLVKLLMRLYEPDSGAILLNDIDIREFDPAEYRAGLGVVFQDFQLFAATLGENVAMDVLPASDARRPGILEGLRKSRFGDRLSGLPQGLETPLLREFETTGTNLSGGEAQKLAMARILSRSPSLSILDEPSSALDPMSEYQLNQTMQSELAGSTVVYISHRLSTTRMAHRICLLEDGAVKEEGTHEDLMRAGGTYASMFTLQAERYQPFST
jgi:ATP-binding cassette subfamily B protein